MSAPDFQELLSPYLFSSATNFTYTDGEHGVLTRKVCPAFRTHMLIDVIQAEYFLKYIRILEEERDKFVKIANDFHTTEENNNASPS